MYEFETFKEDMLHLVCVYTKEKKNTDGALVTNKKMLSTHLNVFRNHSMGAFNSSGNTTGCNLETELEGYIRISSYPSLSLAKAFSNICQISC